MVDKGTEGLKGAPFHCAAAGREAARPQGGAGWDAGS